MRSTTIATALTALSLAAAQSVTGALGDAQISTNNPIGVTYQAILPDSKTTGIRGYIAGTSNANGTGVYFNINFYGFADQSLGPFIYHLHDAPVPSSGNCTGTLAHLDPTIRGEKPACDATQPEKCQVGDLAGKHGNITTSPFQTRYLDLYASTTTGVTGFFGNRSVVVHTANATRLTCANFTLVAGTPSGSSPSPTATPFMGAAGAKGVSWGILGAAVVGALAL